MDPRLPANTPSDSPSAQPQPAPLSSLPPVAPRPMQDIVTPQPAAALPPQPSSPTAPSGIAPAGPPSVPPKRDFQPPQEIMQQAAQNDRKRSLAKGFKSFLSVITFFATVIIAASLINAFVFQSYYVDGTSMVPTLDNDDRLIIDKLGKTAAAAQGKPYIPKRGDVVVLDSAILDQYGHEEQLIKRVIGLPGDKLRIADGAVTVVNAQNPQGFNVDQQLGLELSPTFSEGALEITVPENNVFVLGDNRGINGSFDSRSFGPVSTDKIQGRLAMRIFPFNNTRVF